LGKNIFHEVTIDKRGKHPKYNKFDRELIKQHVESFSPSISHYRQEHAPNRKNLPSDLTITKMHRDFIQKYPNLKCSYDLYRDYITNGMKIRFTSLGNEESEQCEIFKLHNPCHNEKNLDLFDCSICSDWNIHQKKASKGRDKYRTDSENIINSNTLCVSADLQKVIMLPRLQMFKRAIFTQRIIAFNESFVPLGKKPKTKPFACLWNESVSGRKKEDIVSTFHAFFIYNRDLKSFINWLDNCSAQNKNWTLFSYLTNIINSSLIAADSIILRYFEPEHTFMSADSFHHLRNRRFTLLQGNLIFC
jgi:hypothetical protein